MFEMQVLAYQANVTRVTTFMMAKEVSMRTYNQIGVSDAFHPLSHHQNDPAKLDRLAKVQTYHSEAYARFLKRMASTQDGDGTLLDHSILVLRLEHEQQRHAQQRSAADRGVRSWRTARSRAASTCTIRRTRRSRTCGSRCSKRAGIPIEKHGISTGVLSEV